MAEEDKWLPRMTQSFMALDSSTHAIDTKQFAAAMQEARRRGGAVSPLPVTGLQRRLAHCQAR